MWDKGKSYGVLSKLENFAIDYESCGDPISIIIFEQTPGSLV